MPGEKSAHCYFAAGSEKDIDRITHNIQSSDYKVKLNKNYWIEKKNVIDEELHHHQSGHRRLGDRNAG